MLCCDTLDGLARPFRPIHGAAPVSLYMRLGTKQPPYRKPRLYEAVVATTRTLDAAIAAPGTDVACAQRETSCAAAIQLSVLRHNLAARNANGDILMVGADRRRLPICKLQAAETRGHCRIVLANFYRLEDRC